MKIFITLLALVTLMRTARAELTVFAAASTTDVMKALATAFEKRGGETIRFNFAGTGALARQIEAGAPADCFIAANRKWMDYLEQKHQLRPNSRKNVAGNQLVLVAPENSSLTFETFPAALRGRLAIGDPKSVPAGAYAMQALQQLNYADALSKRFIKGKDVRTVLLYVERGEVEAGIVYATDAQRTERVSMLGPLPASSHDPIIYPAAILKEASSSAAAFLDFMRSSVGRAIFTAYGFTEPMP